MIVGINLDSIDAKKHTAPAGNIRIDNNVNIVHVKNTKIPIFDEKISQIGFKFTTKYSKEDAVIGTVTITGSVLFRGDTEQIKKTYSEEKKLPEKIGLMVINAILTKCITQTIHIAEQVSLPPPISMPSVSHKKKQNLEYIE